MALRSSKVGKSLITSW